jgi:hypothetical protein
MSKPKGKKLIGGYRYGDAVQSLDAFNGRRTPPPPINDRGPATMLIPKGATGLVHGQAHAAEEYLDIEFEVWPNTYARVETRLEQVAKA